MTRFPWHLAALAGMIDINIKDVCKIQKGLEVLFKFKKPKGCSVTRTNRNTSRATNLENLCPRALHIRVFLESTAKYTQYAKSNPTSRSEGSTFSCISW